MNKYLYFSTTNVLHSLQSLALVGLVNAKQTSKFRAKAQAQPNDQAFLFCLIASWIPAPGSFLFSLRNHDDLAPFKAPLLDENHVAVIYRHSEFGPVLGLDFVIWDSAGSNDYSYTDFGECFRPPPGYIFNNTATQSLLAGSLYFTPAEIEVLYFT